MAEPLRILFLSAEVAPFAKTGGLGDIGGSLPKALHDMGHDVRVMMPAYANIEAGYPGVGSMPLQLNVPTGSGVISAGAFEGRLPGSDVPVYFIAEHNLFNRPNIYGYWDDPYRFAFFSKAAFELTSHLDWRPDLLHAHDWHTAPAVVWLATAGQADDRFRGIGSVFTIHNLAHQGKTSWNVFEYMQLYTHGLAEEGYGEVNFMARGIYHANIINTVSPTYAREIMTYEGGAGLDGLLRHRQRDLHGILNGLDYDEWNPATDPRLPAHYTVEAREARDENRRALQAALGLPQLSNIPILAMISRMDWQKGFDLMGHAIHLLMNGYSGPAQFVVLGTGQPHYENMFRQLAGYHREKMAAYIGYQANLAPLIYAGSDMFLMPSLFEPCGLGQMIAMRYGSVPIVRATGGLADTVHDGITGFTFYDFNGDSLWHAIQRATYVYNTDREGWRRIQTNGMHANFSWQRSAEAYQQLYEWARAQMLYRG
ncbi:glycogen synthase [Promineifilum sp.]|uniref:glycogen synthase n=1 Tax=Promineifilum sp. TaxID=2664178 RepID=UPI0035B099AB